MLQLLLPLLSVHSVHPRHLLEQPADFLPPEREPLGLAPPGNDAVLLLGRQVEELLDERAVDKARKGLRLLVALVRAVPVYPKRQRLRSER